MATWEKAKAIAGVTDEEKFVADEGTVIVQFPNVLSSASVDELEEFFDLFIKKARRRAKQREEARKEGVKNLYPDPKPSDGE